MTAARDKAYARRDVFWEPLPDEDGNKRAPEKDDTLALEEDAVPAVHGVEELHLRHEERVDGPGRVDEVVPCEAGETVPDELRRDQPAGPRYRSGLRK